MSALKLSADTFFWPRLDSVRNIDTLKKKHISFTLKSEGYGPTTTTVYARQRLMSSLCVDTNGKSIALNEKAKTAAEMMVFARYVMFSEVYWHHAVRSATAMFQRAFFEMHRRGGDWESLLLLSSSTGVPLTRWAFTCFETGVRPFLQLPWSVRHR